MSAAEIEEIAEILGAGVAKALLGKDVLSDELPWVTGSIGLLGTRPSYELMMGCDTLLTVGSNFPYTQFMPPFGQARAVQIDIDGKLVGMRYPYELNLVGDATTTLRALIPHLRRNENRDWRAGIESNVSDWWEAMDREAEVEAEPVNPQLLFHVASAQLPTNAIVAADSGSSANWYARQLKFRGDMRGSLSGTLATMGPGVPYVIGAKFAQPDRPAVAFVGDGAMQMNGLAELITVKHYWQQWSDPRLVVAVLHNNDLNQVTWEMRAMEGSPKFAESADPAGRGLRGVRREPGTAGHHRRRPGPARGRLATGAVRGPADRPRRPRRPERAPGAAARHAGGDEGHRARAHARRRGPVGRGQGRCEDQGGGAACRDRTDAGR